MRRPWIIMGIFLYIWLMVGLLTGIAALLGPIEWLRTAFAQHGWWADWEAWAMGGVAAGGLVASVLMARWLVRRILQATWPVRVGIPLALTVAAAFSLWGWADRGQASSGGGSEAALAANWPAAAQAAALGEDR